MHIKTMNCIVDIKRGDYVSKLAVALILKSVF